MNSLLKFHAANEQRYYILEKNKQTGYIPDFQSKTHTSIYMNTIFSLSYLSHLSWVYALHETGK